MKRNEKVKVIKKRDPSRSLISAMEILIEMYPERAERILAKVRGERPNARAGDFVIAKPHG